MVNNHSHQSHACKIYAIPQYYKSPVSSDKYVLDHECKKEKKKRKKERKKESVMPPDQLRDTRSVIFVITCLQLEKNN